MSKDSLLTFHVFSKKSFMLENVKFRRWNISKHLPNVKGLSNFAIDICSKKSSISKMCSPNNDYSTLQNKASSKKQASKICSNCRNFSNLSFNILTLHYFEHIEKAVKFKGNGLQKRSVWGCFQLSIRCSYVTTPEFLFLNVTIRYNGNS